MSRTCCIRRLLSRRRRAWNIAALLDPEAGIRVEKVLDIRRQLGEGRYSVAERLDSVIARMIRDLS